jgi:hypothetical protein
MADGGEGSVTVWIGAMKAGEGVAAQKLWTRYFETVVRVARGSLRNSSSAARDEEDIALRARKTIGCNYGRSLTQFARASCIVVRLPVRHGRPRTSPTPR